MTTDLLGNVFVIGWYQIATNSGALIRKLAGPPQLSCNHGGGQLRLSWPTNATGFVLQSATTLTNGGDWQNLSLTTTITNGRTW